MKKFLFPLLFVFLAFAFKGDAGNVWFTLPESLPYKAASFPVIGFTSTTDTNKYIIMPGGLVNDSISRRVIRLKPVTGGFDTLPPLPQRSMNGAGFKLGDSIYYAGGYMPGWLEIKLTPRDTIFDIAFPSKDTGYAAGDSNRVSKSTNGGESWANVNLPGASKKIYNLNFINPLTGWASCTGDANKLYKTTDAGANWTAKLSHSETFYGLDFVGDSIGFISGTGNQIGRTTNQGTNWSFVSFNTAVWNSVDFLNASTGLMCGTDGKIAKSTNGGVNWTLAGTSGTSQVLNSIKMITSTKAVAVGDSGRILYSSNGGVNWSFQESGITQKLREIQNSDSLNFAVCGDEGVYLYSSNGGIKWNRRKGITPNNLYSISEPLRESDVIIGGKDGMMFKDNNSKFKYDISNRTYKLRIAPTVGTWQMMDTLPKPLAEIFNSSATTREQLAFVAGGLTLSDSVSNSVYYFNARINRWFSTTSLGRQLSEGSLVSMNDSQMVYVGGRKHDTEFSSSTYRAKIIYDASGVGLITWTTGASYPIGGVFAHGGMAFKSAGVAVFVGGNVVVHHDASAPFDNAFKYNFRDDQFFSLDRTILPICHTGIDGFEISLPGSDNNGVVPVGIYAPGGMTGNNYNLTDAIQVYKNPDITNINENISEVKDFHLEQNYPNPFNPFTTIAFVLREKGFVKLYVYDLTGKVVSVIVNQSMQAGRHEVNFNGINLASGIYFYKLTANDFIDVKKMVLVK